MLSKSQESFEKSKSGQGWTVTVTNRGVQFFFDKDGTFEFLCKNKS